MEKYIERPVKENRIVVKIGSNSLMHPETGRPDYIKIERLAKELTDIRNRGNDVCLVSSGAIAVGRQMLKAESKPSSLPEKQAFASIGQSKLMMIYQQAFGEYNQEIGQILMTKYTILNPEARKNAQNAFDKLFEMGVIPIVNANDAISTYDIQFGDNDTLSAIVASVVSAHRLILMSDIDGLYDSDPRKNPDAKLISRVDDINEDIMGMAGSGAGSDFGTGGMLTKLIAAKIATQSGVSMLIVNAADVSVLHRIFDGEKAGTFFAPKYDENFDILSYIASTLVS
ncbi:MAG: glutamate 5-kinase [Lachnospiraceae bacterium]|nr:glutamate 5-kinase [Lachnospiraceae bacterium]